MDESIGNFFKSLFDFSFTTFITTRLIKLIYVIALIAIGLTTLFIIVASFGVSAAAGLAGLLVIAPLFVLFATIYTRVLLELIIVVFRISEHAAEIAAQGRRDARASDGEATVARSQD